MGFARQDAPLRHGHSPPVRGRGWVLRARRTMLDSEIAFGNRSKRCPRRGVAKKKCGPESRTPARGMHGQRELVPFLFRMAFLAHLALVGRFDAALVLAL